MFITKTAEPGGRSGVVGRGVSRDSCLRCYLLVGRAQVQGWQRKFVLLLGSPGAPGKGPGARSSPDHPVQAPRRAGPRLQPCVGSMPGSGAGHPTQALPLSPSFPLVLSFPLLPPSSSLPLRPGRQADADCGSEEVTPGGLARQQQANRAFCSERPGGADCPASPPPVTSRRGAHQALAPDASVFGKGPCSVLHLP